MSLFQFRPFVGGVGLSSLGIQVSMRKRSAKRGGIRVWLERFERFGRVECLGVPPLRAKSGAFGRDDEAFLDGWFLKEAVRL
jgi:hypothetical protein